MKVANLKANPVFKIKFSRSSLLTLDMVAEFREGFFHAF